MRRVVVTGIGITSSIGNNAEEVTASLKAGSQALFMPLNMQNWVSAAKSMARSKWMLLITLTANACGLWVRARLCGDRYGTGNC